VLPQAALHAVFFKDVLEHFMMISSGAECALGYH
jgi:hypothetical protein